MKKTILITIMTLLIFSINAAPANALSENAERFLLHCRAIGAPFPPEHWDKLDLRDAAIEVLDAIEAGYHDPWPLDFCIKAIGHTKFPIDIDRILAYEDQMVYSVLRALRGFPHEKAVETYLKYIDSDRAPKRESAVLGLEAVDFEKIKDGADWKPEVLNALRNARQKEKVDWLIPKMDKAIATVQAAPVPKKKDIQ